MTPGDRLAIQDLVARYAAYVDDRELDLATALFALDGVLVPPGRDPAVGRPAVRRALGRLEKVDRTVHTIGGLVLDQTGPHAVEGRLTGEAHHVTRKADGTHDHVWHLVYRDSYRRINGHWLFARRALDLRFAEDREVRT